MQHIHNATAKKGTISEMKKLQMQKLRNAKIKMQDLTNAKAKKCKIQEMQKLRNALKKYNK